MPQAATMSHDSDSTRPPATAPPHAAGIAAGGDHVAGDQFDLSGDFSAATLNIKSTIYHWDREHPIDPARIAAAQQLLGQLPTDSIPAYAPLPDGSRMPFSPNPLFVGRATDLLTLVGRLKSGAPTAIGQIAAATGLGGIGKTNLATELVHRYGAFFAGGVFWLSFGEPAHIPFEIAACGGAAGMNLRPDFASLPLAQQLAAVERSWASAIPRLLVFDNCDTEDAEALVQRYRPASGGCHVLITSRRAHWDASSGVQAHALGVLQRDESIALLQRFRPGMEASAAAALAAELGDLPLALHLAGSFLKLFHTLTVKAYLEELRDHRLLEHESLQGLDVLISPTGHGLHVGRSFALSYERLRPEEPGDALARRLLACAACCAPGEAIPCSLLYASVEHADAADQRRSQRALHRLQALGLLDLDQERDSASMHRLLVQFVQSQPGSDVAQQAIEHALFAAIDERRDAAGYLTQFEMLLPHLRQSTEQALPGADSTAAALANWLGFYLKQTANYADARFSYERALAIREAMLGPQHPHTAQSLNNLGSLLHAMGELAAARPYYERALAIREALLGPQHPETANSLNNMGFLLHAMGELAAARPYYERALAIYEQVLGPQHPETANSLSWMGVLLHSEGQHAAAAGYVRRAVQIFEAALGSGHPDTNAAREWLETIEERRE